MTCFGRCPTITRNALGTVCLAAVLTLAACGGGSGDSPTALPPTVTPAAPLTGPLTVGPVAWARAVDPGSGAPSAIATSFGVAESIIAAIPIQNVDAGASFTATWVYNDTPLERSTTTTVAASQQTETWLVFRLDLPAGSTWPTGTYGVTVSANGVVAQQSTIEVAAG